MTEASGAHEALRGARALVTGAAGFVGARLVRELLAVGAEPFALDAPGSADAPRLAGVRCPRMEADLSDPAAARDAISEVDPHFVFHLAGTIDMSPRADAPALVAANVTAAANVVAACEHAASLRLAVHTGTCAEYGDARERTGEDSPIGPTSLYGATKAAGTLAARAVAGERGVPLAVLRPYNLYGEHEAPARLVPHVALSLLAGREVPLTGGEQRKDYLYVGDLAGAYLAAARAAKAAAGGVFNVAAGTAVSVRGLVEALADALGADRSLLRFGAVPYRDNEMWSQEADVSRAAEVLGWRAATTLEEGLARTAAWYRENRDLYGR